MKDRLRDTCTYGSSWSRKGTIVGSEDRSKAVEEEIKIDMGFLRCVILIIKVGS